MSDFNAIDPCTGQQRRVAPLHTPDQVEAQLAAVHWGQAAWAQAGFAERARALHALADGLLAEQASLATLMADEMGKPLAQGVAEIGKCADACRWAAEHGPAALADAPVELPGASEAWVRRRPLGVVLAVMPWNFPFWQVIRCAAPAMIAGNGVLLKHAPSVPGCADALERLFADAGLPLRQVRVAVDAIPALLADRRVAAGALTGSTLAGRAFASAAGQALKPVVLELGGSDAFIVLDDADVARAAEVGACSRLLNAGQSCIAAKRFIVTQAVAAPFIDALVARFAACVVGDPRAPSTTVGPLARRDLRDTLAQQVADSVARGARVAFTAPAPNQGSFYPPTVLTEVHADMAAWTAELFGPVAAVRVVASADQALAAANDSVYGLGASVWTRSSQQQQRFVRALNVGSVVVNGMVRSDSRLPFGGIADSGFGRELGRDGFFAFTNTQAVIRDAG